MADRASGLHDRLNRISHWDVNVTDLERSRAWYEATTTLRVVARTKASQRFPSFGLASGSFTGSITKLIITICYPRLVVFFLLKHFNIWYRS